MGQQEWGMELEKGSEWIKIERRVLDEMPIALCCIEVLVDEKGAPYDFRFLYSNQKHSELEKVQAGELVGKCFYEFFENADQKWLPYYYDTAYHGKRHVLNDYSPEIDRFLLIHTYQLSPGICGCVLQDVSRRRQLEMELEKNYERMKRLLRMATDLIFNYDPDTRTLYASEQDIHRYSILPKIRNVPDGLAEEGLLHSDSLPIFREKLSCLKKGESEVSFNIRARLKKDQEFRWYNLTFLDYVERGTDQKKVLSYLKDIDDIVTDQRRRLKDEVETDPLTGIYNVRTGKRLIIDRLEMFSGGSYQILFLMDLDDFKEINDTEGHQVGDQVLIRFAGILKKVFRSYDIVYRLGGDEFAVFAGNISEPEEAVQSIMLRFFTELSRAKFPNAPVQIKSSVGVFVSGRKRTFDYFYRQADQAMYRTKVRGKNNFTLIWDEEE